MDSTAKRLLHSRLTIAQDSARLHLENGLRSLAYEVEVALKEIAEGKPLNNHLIHNANSLTQDIIRWNMALDLLPIVDYKPPPPTKAGDQCPHGRFWFAEVASDNPDHPVGALSIDCDGCNPPPMPKKPVSKRRKV
jgi:hypothetical protein